MGDMAGVAERLRLVRAARRKFLRMWAIDQALVEPLLDRMAAELSAAAGVAGRADRPAEDIESLHGDAPDADRG